MSLKKIAVILFLIITLGGGLFAYQKNKQNKELVEHNKKKFQQILEFSQKSSSGGLPVMVGIIKKFHKLNGQYPKDLMQLYPDFIPEKDLITTIKWKYETGNGTFILKKLTKSNQVYAMGPDMRLKSGKNAALPSLQSVATIDTLEKNKKSSNRLNPKVKTNYKKDVKEKSKTFISNRTKPSNQIKSTTPEKIKKAKPEFTIVEKELNNDEKFLLSINTTNLYIWKTRTGIIGFSNIQYPDQKDLIIYKNNAWVEYKYNKNHNNKK